MSAAPSLQPLTPHELATFCDRHSIAPSRFGRRFVNDPGLLRDLRNGRKLRVATLARVRSAMVQMEGC